MLEATPSLSQSSYISYGAQNNNYSGNDWLRAGVQSSTSTRYISLVQFNVAPYMNAIVDSAALRLYSFDDGDVWKAETTILAKRNTSSFTASNVTYNSRPSYRDTSDDQNQETCTASGNNIWYEWNIKDIVQAWLSGTANYGLTLIQDGLSTAKGKVFKKSGAYAPKLELNYYMPIKIAPSQGLISKQMIKIMIAPTQGVINKTVTGMKIAAAQGSINKTIF